jgi:hypothetical protein
MLIQVLVACLFASCCTSAENTTQPTAGDAPPPRRPTPRNPPYSIGFYNATNQRLDEVFARWSVKGFPWLAGAGILSPDPQHYGQGASSDFQPDPIPQSVTLTWKTPDGQRHERLMAVAEKVKDLKGFAGTIYFKFTDAGWVVVPLTDEEMHRAKKRGAKKRGQAKKRGHS